MNRTLAGALAVAVLTLGTSAAVAESADPSADLESQLIEQATTAIDHRALAKHFRAKARNARNEAARHEHMVHAYGSRLAGKEHCERLVAAYEEQATSYGALAELHDEAARAAEH